MNKVYYCNCKDWKENIEKLNSGWIVNFSHFGKGYEGKTMKYCPWCSKKLKEVKK